MPLRVGLIGCGRISDRHVQVIRALADDLALAAVCDLAEDKARRAAGDSGAAVYTDFEAMLRDEALDIVTILTESGSHARIGSVVAPRIKTLVIEKPMSLTLDDADRLIEACDINRTRLFVVKQNRYNRPVTFLRRALEAGRFGKLVMGTVRVRWCRRQEYYAQDAWRGTWKDDGGVLTNQASHHMDLLQWMMGPVESVKAYTTTRLVDIETEDTAVAILRFTSGALGAVEATTATRPKDLEGGISILGERGSVVIGGFAVNKLETWNFDAPAPEDADIHTASVHPPNVYGLGHYEFYKDVIDSIRTGRRAMLDGLEGRKSLELINAIYESAASGNEIRLRYVPRGVQLGHYGDVVSKFKIPLVDLRAQYEAIRSEIDPAIQKVLDTTSFILGGEVDAFEREFAAYCEAKHAVGCANGTNAITLALEALGVKRGDEVITVAHTFIASAEAVSALGARPVFVDIRPDTLLMDVSKIEAAITPRTRAILAVHLYGQMVDMDPLLALADHHHLKVVEDAAQAHGARYKGRRAGSIGHAATFSFYPGKNLGAYGDAGAVVTNEAEVAAWIKKARNHGRANKYEHDFEARSSRMDGLQGAILRVKLRHLDAWNARRRELAAEYRALLQPNPSLRIVAVNPDCEPVYHLFVIQTAARDALVERLQAAGYEAGVHYPIPLHEQKAYAYLNMKSGTLPVTEKSARDVLSLPLYPELPADALSAISAIVNSR